MFCKNFREANYKSITKFGVNKNFKKMLKQLHTSDFDNTIKFTEN